MKKKRLHKRLHKRSLRKKIQNSLLLSSFLSIAISLFAISILITGLAQPIGGFLTNTVNNKIHENYITSNERFVEKIIDFRENSEFAEYKIIPYEQMIQMDFANEPRFFGEEEELIILEAELFNREEKYLTVSGNTETGEKITVEEKKTILVSTIAAIESIDDTLTFSEILGFDWVNITLTIEGQEEFSIPKIKTETVGKKVHEINSTMYIINDDGDKIGTITTSLNTAIVGFVFIPISVIFLLIALITFIIVKIILMPFMHNILKPIKQLNKQLSDIASNDLECTEVTIEQKRPPREIKELITSSNTIMTKLRASFHLLENQKDELEAQNEELDNQKEELEAQNIELDSQKEELEAQNEELDSQNIELMESQIKLKKAQDQLVQSEKLASMGQLTAAIAHEINTPLGAVSSNSQMLEMMIDKLKKAIEDKNCESAFKLADKLKKSNAITIDAAERVNEIIKNLKNFSRIDQAEFQNADVNEGIQSVLVLTSNLWKNKVVLNEQYGEIPLINCYPSMLNQVFMNVIVNAIQASEKNGVMDIITRVDGDMLVVEIIDEGVGIDEKLLENIFESGYTTKPKDEGTGLGLSISRDIIKKHHGTIKAVNNIEKGVTFVITLPIKQIDHDETCDHD